VNRHARKQYLIATLVVSISASLLYLKHYVAVAGFILGFLAFWRGR
jgi:hypothetical protein